MKDKSTEPTTPPAQEPEPRVPITAPGTVAVDVQGQLATLDVSQEDFEDRAASQLMQIFVPLSTNAVPTGVVDARTGQQESRTTINFGQAAYLAYTGARALWNTKKAIAMGAIKLDVSAAPMGTPGPIQ